MTLRWILKLKNMITIENWIFEPDDFYDLNMTKMSKISSKMTFEVLLGSLQLNRLKIFRTDPFQTHPRRSSSLTNESVFPLYRLQVSSDQSLYFGVYWYFGRFFVEFPNRSILYKLYKLSVRIFFQWTLKITKFIFWVPDA